MKQLCRQGPQATPPAGPGDFSTTCLGLLGTVRWEAIANPTLMPNYISTDWASAGLDLSSENLDHWLIFLCSFFITDSELWLSYLVCQKHCRDLTLEFNHRTYVHQCCTTDFCNVSI